MSNAFTLAALSAVAALSIATPIGAVGHRPVVRGEGVEVVLVARDYAFEAPDTLVAGVISIRMRDEGRDPHHWILFRLADSVSLVEFYASMQKGGPSPEGIKSLGGAQDGRAITFDLAAGRYAFGCLHTAADGGSHLSKGMFRALTVRSARTGDRAPGSLPRVDATVTMRDYGYDLTGPLLRAGTRTLRLLNAGPQEHHLLLQRLAPGATLADVQRWRAGDRTGPRPMMPVNGGTTRQSPGETVYWTVELEAGGYLFLCLVADVGDKRQHVDHGMRQEVKVLAVAP
jgi:hypothetical protein